MRLLACSLRSSMKQMKSPFLVGVKCLLRTKKMGGIQTPEKPDHWPVGLCYCCNRSKWLKAAAYLGFNEKRLFRCCCCQKCYDGCPKATSLWRWIWWDDDLYLLNRRWLPVTGYCLKPLLLAQSSSTCPKTESVLPPRNVLNYLKMWSRCRRLIWVVMAFFYLRFVLTLAKALS